MSQAIRIVLKRTEREPGPGPLFLDPHRARHILAAAFDGAGNVPLPLQLVIPRRSEVSYHVVWELVDWVARLGWLHAYRDARYFRVLADVQTAKAWDAAIRTEIALRAEAYRGRGVRR